VGTDPSRITEAFDAAIADGREQAEQLAGLLGVDLGDLRSARAVTFGLGSLVTMYGPGLEGSCWPIESGRFVPYYSQP
jgi:hypothetical protein